MEEVNSKLRQHAREINEIMLLAQSSFKIINYLYLEADDLEREIINQNPFLKYTASIHWRIYIIEIAKLFARRDSDHFNLIRFIQKFKPGNEFARIKNIDKHSIQLWEHNLELEKKNIDNLLLQRDKLYSHTDKNRDHVKNELSIGKAKELLQVVQRIISEIYIAVFEEAVSFEPIGEPLDALKKIIQVLVTKRKDDIAFYTAHAIEHGIDPKEIGL